MAAVEQIPLGTRIPDTPHAVSVSIPKMADVIAYEEHDPEARRKMKSGYPRFVVHECLRAIEAYWQRLFDKPGQPVWLTSSEKMARSLERYLDTSSLKFQKHGGVSGLRLPIDKEVNTRARQFLTHVGGYLSSRQAEDYLVQHGLLEKADDEDIKDNDPEGTIRKILQPLYSLDTPEEIILANCGMNAIYATFLAINEIQAPRGRKSWIRLGWLYADTMHILDKLSDSSSENVDLYDVFDLESLENVLKERPGHFAGIITEAPTNPLIQTPDLTALKSLAEKYEAYLVIDPTINSPANVDVSPYADVIVNSLTKYAANQGDVSMGAVAVTRNCSDREDLHGRIQRLVEKPYERDIKRLAYQIDDYAEMMPIINSNTAAVVERIEKNPAIDKVFWAKKDESKKTYEALARSNDAVGGVISFSLRGEMRAFHDKLTLSKGPSFGMKRTLVSPFMYLAHYDLIKSEEGRNLMARAGIDSDLIRMSVGIEPVEKIIDALEYALKP